jgi:hypothetical protein
VIGDKGLVETDPEVAMKMLGERAKARPALE